MSARSLVQETEAASSEYLVTRLRPLHRHSEIYTIYMVPLNGDYKVSFLAIGDVHGHWDCVIEAIARARSILGEVPDLVLQVGDAEPHRNAEDLAGCRTPKKHRSLGDFSALVTGDIQSPVYFIGGNHEPYVALDALPGPFPAPWGDDLSVYYLGRAGAAILEDKLKVAWLSGISSAHADPGKRSQSRRARTYFSPIDVATMLRDASRLSEIDVLVTHDWPSVLKPDWGNKVTTELIETIKPTLHVCGHMHTSYEGKVGDTIVNAMTAVPPVTKNQGRKRGGWWRLYVRDESGGIRCLAVGK